MLSSDARIHSAYEKHVTSTSTIASAAATAGTTTITTTMTTSMPSNGFIDDYNISLSDETTSKRLHVPTLVNDTDHNSNSNYYYFYNNNSSSSSNNSNSNSSNSSGNSRNYMAELWHIWINESQITNYSQTTTPATTARTTTTTTTLNIPDVISPTTFMLSNMSSSNYGVAQFTARQQQNNTPTVSAFVTGTNYSDVGSNMSQPYALALGSNYGDNVDIALIDSSETLLAGDTDYAAIGSLAVNSANADTMHRSMVQGIGRVHNMALNKNSTLKQMYISGGQEQSSHAVRKTPSDGVVDKSDGGSSFMLLFEDFGEYFYNYNGSSITGTTINNSNLTDLLNRTNCTFVNATTNSTCYELSEEDHNYWALILLLFPILTLFGNILVILAVCRERSLQSVTNYFIVSLAIADLLVAIVPMPFAVYVLVNGTWALPSVVCDFYIAMDVICSTSSIFNLVAISIDRYIAVTQPIKYAKHKNSRRVCLTILLVWAISAAIGSPIVLGLNNTPNRDPDLCVFYNTDFILYSSLSSFYIPTIIMLFLYYNIFKALSSRARKQRAARKPHLSELTGGSVIENIAQTRRLAETALDSGHGSRVLGDEPATNTASGSNEEEDENAVSPDIDDCHVIVNDKSTEFMLATVVEETGIVVAQISSPPQLVVADPNGNHDSGYAPSNVDDVLAGAADSSPPDSPAPSGTLQRSSVSSGRRPTTTEDSPKREPALSVAMKPLSFVRYGVQEAMTLARNDSTLSTTSRTSARKDKKNSQASRFTIYKVHKASKKKREKSSAKKERKATKTLAIVLGVFLFCWLPFFSCNLMDAMCAKFNKDCRPGVTAFILTTWLGYINSFVNPVIYTIFNPEFRKAFKKIMHMG